MSIAERLPTMVDAELVTLRANALRLEAAGGAQMAKAAELLPLIDAEIAERLARKPPKAPPKPRAKAAPKVVGPKVPATAKSLRAAAAKASAA
jgi:hypothetical protein